MHVGVTLGNRCGAVAGRYLAAGLRTHPDGLNMRAIFLHHRQSAAVEASLRIAPHRFFLRVHRVRHRQGLLTDYGVIRFAYSLMSFDHCKQSTVERTGVLLLAEACGRR